MPGKRSGRKAAARTAPAALKKVKIEIPLPPVREYVPGYGPPMAKISLLPTKDSTAVILDKLALPKPEETGPNDRRLLYYFITFSDMPDVKALIPCHKAYTYVDPYEVERWEEENDQRLEEEKKRLAEEPSKLPARRRAGRPKKYQDDTIQDSRPSISQGKSGASLILSDNEENRTLAEQIAGPSLSTPQKRKRAPTIREEGVDETSAEPSSRRAPSEESAVNRQMFWEKAKRRYLTDHSTNADVGTESAGQAPAAAKPLATAQLSRASNLEDYFVPSASVPTSKSKGKASSKHSLSAHSAGTSTPPIHPQFLAAMGSQSMQTSIQPDISTNQITPKPHDMKAQMRTDSAVFLVPDTTQKSLRGGFRFPDDHISHLSPVCTRHVGASDSSESRPKKKVRKDKSTPPTKEKQAKTSASKMKSLKTPKNKQGEEPEADEDVWGVEQLLDDGYRYSGSKKVHMYLVDWTGDYEPSWEPSSNIQDKSLIRVYQDRKRNGTLPRTPIGTPYSNVAEAFEGGIDIDDHRSVVSSDHGDDELLPVTDPAKSGFPGSGGKKMSMPAFSKFDNLLAQYKRVFPPT